MPDVTDGAPCDGSKESVDAVRLVRIVRRQRPGDKIGLTDKGGFLKELVRARRAASGERTALVNRLAAIQSAFLRAELKRRLKAMETHVRRLEAEILRRPGTNSATWPKPMPEGPEICQAPDDRWLDSCRCSGETHV